MIPTIHENLIKLNNQYRENLTKTYNYLENLEIINRRQEEIIQILEKRLDVYDRKDGEEQETERRRDNREREEGHHRDRSRTRDGRDKE